MEIATVAFYHQTLWWDLKKKVLSLIMSDSTFVNINGRFYRMVNVFSEETYCHIHNRRDKSKKLSMKIGDLRDLIQASDKIEEA